MSRVSASPTAPRCSSIRRRGTSASAGRRYFVNQKDGLKTEIVAVAPNGAATPGVTVQVTLTQIQWNSVRRAEGNGFYTWETERKEVAAGSWTVTTAPRRSRSTSRCRTAATSSSRRRRATATGRFAVTRTSFYALGDGYTAWARFDHNRIDLVPERKTYKPGDTARIMIQSPWEQATALVTTEREGIRSHRQFALTSTQQSISVPITEDDIPNVFVSVLLVKGRTQRPPPPPPLPRRRRRRGRRSPPIRPTPASRRSASATSS